MRFPAFPPSRFPAFPLSLLRSSFTASRTEFLVKPIAKERVMTDDRTKKGPQDRSRINIHERYELDYWSNKFGVTPKDLKLAVEKVGVMAKDVRGN